MQGPHRGDRHGVDRVALGTVTRWHGLRVTFPSSAASSNAAEMSAAARRRTPRGAALQRRRLTPRRGPPAEKHRGPRRGTGLNRTKKISAGTRPTVPKILLPLKITAKGCACGQAQCMTEGVGLASGHRWSPVAAGLRRRLPGADAPARLPAARSAPRQARTGHPPQRPRQLANAQTVNGREHQGD